MAYYEIYFSIYQVYLFSCYKVCEIFYDLGNVCEEALI